MLMIPPNSKQLEENVSIMEPFYSSQCNFLRKGRKRGGCFLPLSPRSDRTMAPTLVVSLAFRSPTLRRSRRRALCCYPSILRECSEILSGQILFPSLRRCLNQRVKIAPGQKNRVCEKEERRGRKHERGWNRKRAEEERGIPLERSERVEKTKFGCICGITAKMRK